MYVNGFVLAVPESNKAAYVDVAKKFWPLAKDFGALSQVECWEADVQDGHTTDFRQLVMQGLRQDRVGTNLCNGPTCDIK